MAVFTKLTKEEISQHLKNYNIGELVDFSEILAGIDNSNFIIKTSKGKFILTIFENRIKKEELPFFINLKNHLAHKGILCPAPILDNQGNSLVDLKNKKSAIVTFLSGKTLEPLENGYYNNVTVKHCYEVGKLQAKLHFASQDFNMKRENDLSVNHFKKLFSKFENLVVDQNLKNEINETISFLVKSWKPELPSGAAHLDLFIDNIFFDENSHLSGVIDFYFAANDLLIYDFAITVNAWVFDENNNFCEEKFLALKKGYEEIRKFSKEENDFLRIALIAASTRFLLTRMHDKFFTPKDSLVKIKDPEEYRIKLNYFKNDY